MAELAIQSITNLNTDPTFEAADLAGDDFESLSTAIVVVKNGDVSPHTVTVNPISSPVNTSPTGQINLDPVIMTVAADGVGFLQVPDAYKGLRGRVLLEYDDVTSVTVAVIKPGLAT